MYMVPPSTRLLSSVLMIGFGLAATGCGSIPKGVSKNPALASQTITFGPIASQIVGSAPPALTATASSGLPVSFSSSTSAVCTVSGSTVTLVASGTCTIQATQAGNANYAAATPVSQSFAVNGEYQTITFLPIPNQPENEAAYSIPATYSATSGLPVSFSSLTAAVCTMPPNSTRITFVMVGTCTIEASQAGNAIWAAAAPITQTFTILSATQTITFGTIPPQPVQTTLPLSASSSSGLTVGFTSLTTSVCTVSGANASLIASGTCTIQASQPGTGTIAPAMPVDESFAVNGLSQTITFGTIPAQTVGTPLTLSATATSTLPVSFESSTPLVCSVSGTSASFIASGTCTIQAIQGGNSIYASATPVSQNIAVNGEAQTITFNSIAAQTAGTSFALTATANSGLPVSFASTTSAVCTVSGGEATLAMETAAATCTIQATQAGDGAYAAATPVPQSFTVNPASGNAPGTLSYSANPALYTIGTPITPNILTDSSGTGVTYSISPALPSGLNFDITTGDITGTPAIQVINGSYTVTGTNGSGTSTVNLIITVNFTPATPAQYGYAAPSPEPPFPSYFDTFTPPHFAPNSSAPAVAEWTRSAAPGNAMELSLAALTTDSAFVVYGQTGPAETAPINITPQVLDIAPMLTPAITAGQIAAMLLPTTTSGMPQGMYLTWPENNIGYGNPVAINRTEAWWAGPLTVTVGDTASIYGRNLTYPGTYSSGSTPPLVYLVSTGGGATTAAPVSAANPYKVDFSVATVTPGTYNIWIHNGAGGHFGWSEVQGLSQGATPAQYGPATLTVSATSPWDCEASGPSSFNVMTGYGATGDGATDDTIAITNAITAAGSYANNSSHPYATIYFPAGTYMVTTGFQPPNNVCFMGAGTTNWQNQSVSTPTASILRLSQTNLTCTYPPPAYVQSGGAFIWANEGVTGGGSNNVEFTDMVLDANGNIPCMWMTTSGGSGLASQSTQVRFRGEHNAKFDHIVLNGTGAGVSWEGGGGFASFDFSGGVNYYLTDSIIIGSGFENIGTNQVFVTGNTFLEADNNGGVMGNTSPTETSFWNNTMEDLAKFNTDAVAAGNPSAQIPYNGGSASLRAAFASSYNPLSGGYPLYITNIGPYGEGRIGGAEIYETGLIYIGQNTNLNAGPCDPNNTNGSYPDSYPGCYEGPNPPDTATNQNSGEQVLFETAGTDYGGFALASSSNTVEVSGLTETSCGFTPSGPCIGEDTVIVGGTGLGQNRHIIAQSGDTVTVAPAWQVVPDATSRVYIASVTYQVAVYDNIEQGKADHVNRYTSLTGVEPWSNVYGLVYDGNQVSNVGDGINDATLEESSRQPQNWIVPNYFNLFTNNTIKGAYTGIAIDDLTSYGPGEAGDQYAVSFVGDIFRNNILGTADSTTPVNTGTIHTGIDFTPCPQSSCTSGGVTYQGGDTIQGIVLDGNTVVINPYNYSGIYWDNWPGPGSEIPTGLWTDAGPVPIIDTLMNNNSFTLLPSTVSGYTGPSYGMSFGSTNTYTPAQPTTGDSCVETGTNPLIGFANATPPTPVTFACTQK